MNDATIADAVGVSQSRSRRHRLDAPELQPIRRGAERLVRSLGVADLGVIAAPDNDARRLHAAAGRLPDDPERAAIEID